MADSDADEGVIALPRPHYPETGPWAVLSRLGVVAIVCAILFASLAPRSFVPRLLYSTHLEHFAVFYMAGVALAAAFPRSRLRRLMLPLAVLAVAVEALRVPLGKSLTDSYLNLLCDVGGGFGSFVPIAIDRFRRRFGPPRGYS
jgi:hypothetical protein